MPRKNEAEVLAYVNQLRARYHVGDPLPEMPPDLTPEQYWIDGGTIIKHCPVAVALGRSCSATGVSLRGECVRFPGFVTRFILDHDRRFYQSQF